MDLWPNTLSYKAVILAYTKIKDPGVSLQAESILWRVKYWYRTGEYFIFPKPYNVGCLIVPFVYIFLHIEFENWSISSMNKLTKFIVNSYNRVIVFLCLGCILDKAYYK